jgi:MFS family permease
MTRKKMNFGAVVAFGFAACILYGVGAGLRSDIGILLPPLAAHSGVSYEDASFCVAVMQIVFGAAQPVFGILAARTSNRLVLILGAALLAASLGSMLLFTGFAALFLSLGIIFGLGAGALAFGLVLSSSIAFVGRENAMTVSGMLNAAAGMVGFALSPAMQAMLSAGGLPLTVGALCALCAVLLPVILIVTKRDAAELRKPDEKEEPSYAAALFSEAFTNRTFLLLLLGFSTCGFHMVIIESHLFSEFVLHGIDAMQASWAFSVYGIATIAGALLSGYLSTRLPKGRLLVFYYGFRALWVLLYLWVMPKNIVTAVIFSAGLGLTGDATVSPTAGLVSERFPLKKVATLIGVLFFAHQIGAFASAWAGGVIREVSGGYALVWIIDAALCLFACAVSFLIPKRKA